MFIGVAGLIGAGKSTLTQQLADHLGYDTAFEPVETNPYLDDFYQDMGRWTFNMQMFLLSARFQQHQEIIWSPAHQEGRGIVQDRTIYEDTIFATMHYNDGIVDDRDFGTYLSHFNVMRRYLQYPDVILYLRVSPEKALERINLRSRDAEVGIPLEYLQGLYEGYEDFVEEMARYTTVVTLDWSEFRPLSEVASAIEEATQKDQKFLRSIRRI